MISWSLLISATGQTLYMVFTALFFGTLIGLPVGIILFLTGNRTLGALVNMIRSFPFAILLIALIPFTRVLVGTSLGTTASIVPLAVAAAPYLARVVQTSLQGVDPHLIEAARVMGSTQLDIIRKVLLPEALPHLIASFTVATVNLIGYSAMAGLVGGGGLGTVAIIYGYQRFDGPLMMATVMLLIAIVQGIQWLGGWWSRSLLIKRGLQCGLIPVFFCWLFLSACSKKGDLHTLRVAATPTPQAEILQFIKPKLKAEGVDLEILIVNDYNIPNRALAEREVEANYFQHTPFMDEQIQAFGYKIECFAQIHLEPLGLYAKKIARLQDLPDQGVVALPSDPTNEYRALLLMEKAGLITLKETATLVATTADIASNPKRLVFHEVDAAMLPRTLDSVDLAAIPTNFALQAKLNPARDALALETGQSPYANIVAIRDGDGTDPRLTILRKLMLTEEVKTFILNRYGGAIIPVLDLCTEPASAQMRGP